MTVTEYITDVKQQADKLSHQIAELKKAVEKPALIDVADTSVEYRLDMLVVKEKLREAKNTLSILIAYMNRS